MSTFVGIFLELTVVAIWFITFILSASFFKYLIEDQLWGRAVLALFSIIFHLTIPLWIIATYL